MTNAFSSGGSSRPRLCRSDHQPNMLEYIDTTLNESFVSRLKLQTPTTISNKSDQFGNTLVDQYLLYIFCQKLHPNRSDHRTEQIFHSLHQLFCFHGRISKAFFEYSPSTINRTSSMNYTNFIWNEFDVNMLLELACFLLKYRLCDIFSTGTNPNRQNNILGYFLETIVIYYLSTYHRDYFLNSRSKEMLFPYPSIALSSDEDKDQILFNKFLKTIHDNGEIHFDIRPIRLLLQSDAYQFLNKKLENKKIGFLNFFETILRFQRDCSCRSLKTLCRLKIKMSIQHFPNDIKQLALYPTITDRLLNYLTYENKFALESFV